MTSLSKTMVGTSKEDSEYDFIPDLPSGDLDHYRKQAKFNWKHLKVTLEGSAENLKLKYHIWNTLEADPFFVHPAVTPTVDEQKRQTAILMDRIKKHNFSPSHRLFKKCYPEMIQHMLISCEAYISYNINISVKTAIGIYAIASTLLSLGTERHKPMFEAVWNRKILSALALTEVAHGSNTKNMQTTSTYDPETQEFVINTPDFKAAKCWVGNLGKTCTVSLVFAQLYTADGSCHGLHGFVVHVRDPNTMLPYPSVIVGDIGEKTGLNGVDNGFIMFQNHRVPRESLLNRIGDVTPKGEYQRSFSKPGEVLGAVLQNLTLVRVGIINNCAYILGNSITIALRYAAQRKQFGEPGEEEMPILEYELHQWRLFPYLAAAVVFKIFSKIFAKIYLDKIFKYQEVDRMSEMVAEMHSIVSACKPLLTWTAHQSTQEAREACGGHGYLKASRLGDLRDDFDPFLTFEGDNHVLGQQSSNWMLRQWDECHHQNNPVSSPLGSISFIKNASNILKTSFSARGAASVGYVRFTLSAYEWLICWLLKTTDSRLKQKLANGETKFAARCSSQVYRSSVLTRAYSEYIVLKYCSQKISTVDQSLQPVLSNLLILYGLTSLDKHLVLLYQGGYSSDSSLVDMVREGILEYCARVKPDAIAIVDALAPPDFILNSVLGNSDGKLYQHLQREFFSYPGAMERPHWWRDINSKL